jgi:5-methylthioadenosine/S-adenosylhomocysteine deaminase
VRQSVCAQPRRAELNLWQEHVNEFNEMVHRHGKTPVQWADEISILSPRTIIGHGIFLDEHSWLHWHSRDDLNILSRAKTTVAHCPSPFARYGQMLEHFGHISGLA